MKCLCGFNQKPENMKTLLTHVDDCMSNGFLSNLNKGVSVVWREREFVVTDEPKSADNIIETVEIPAGRIPVDETQLVDRVNARFSVEEEKPVKKRSSRTKKKK